MIFESLLTALFSLAPAPGQAAQPVQPAQAVRSEKPQPPKAAASKSEPKKSAPDKAPAKAMSAEVKSLVDRMQAFYENTADFTARFEQKYTYKTFKRTQTSSGDVTFKKPGLMRWEYQSPSKKTFVLAGDKVYAYDPEAMLLTKASIGTNQLSAAVTFLFGQGKLADEFEIEKVACQDCAGALLQLTPLQPDPRFKRILLEVDPKSAQVIRSTVVDPDGSTNRITFKSLKTNTGVSLDAFKLEPPEGTQVQDLTRGK